LFKNISIVANLTVPLAPRVADALAEGQLNQLRDKSVVEGITAIVLFPRVEIDTSYAGER
jgi:hypothetical protein